MKLGLLYAGQGSQMPGMGLDFYEKHEKFCEIFDLLPCSQRELAFHGPAELLKDTRNTQPVMVAFAAGINALLLPALAERGIYPAMAAGLSLGEYSALEAAGVFDEKTAVRLVSLRAEAMAKAAEGIECAMKAVLGSDRKTVQECCRRAEAETGKLVQAVNYNCPGQIVIAGQKEAAERAGELAAEQGAKRVMNLAVSGPFHTEYMKPVSMVLQQAFSETTFGKMKFPVVFNCTGRILGEEETVAGLLEKQVCSSVYFEDAIRSMEEAGIDTIIEVGPGKVLSGFVKKTAPKIRTLSLEKEGDLETIWKEIGKA